MRRILMLILLAAFEVHAGPLVEPYLGYTFGTARPTGVPSTHHRGVTYGGRVGYQMLGAMAGVEYQTGRGTDSANSSNDLTPSNLGVFAGYNFPILIRGYISYAPVARLTAEHAGYDHTFDGGEAIKYGVGYTGLPFLSVNFEYVTTHYRGLDTEMYGVTLSLPVVF